MLDVVVGVFAVWGAVSVLTYVIPALFANVRGVQNLRKKYSAEWAVVTGASSGIGRAIAEALAKQGINVVIAALEDELLSKTHENLCNQYPERQFRSVGVNLADPEGKYMEILAKETADIHVSLLFNNAGAWLRWPRPPPLPPRKLSPSTPPPHPALAAPLVAAGLLRRI